MLLSWFSTCDSDPQIIRLVNVLLFLQVILLPCQIPSGSSIVFNLISNIWDEKFYSDWVGLERTCSLLIGCMTLQVWIRFSVYDYAMESDVFSWGCTQHVTCNLREEGCEWNIRPYYQVVHRWLNGKHFLIQHLFNHNIPFRINLTHC